MDICMLGEEPPIEPAGFIILTMGIVVSELRPPHLITHENHRYPRRSIVMAKKFLTWRLRSFFTAGSLLTPSPQFQLRLSSVPSRLPSPFASLCLRLHETKRCTGGILLGNRCFCPCSQMTNGGNQWIPRS
jgi:hypothetical protein